MKISQVCESPLPQTIQKTRQKIAVPTLTRGTAILSQNRITVLYGSAWESRPNLTPSMFIILYRFGISQILLIIGRLYLRALQPLRGMEL